MAGPGAVGATSTRRQLVARDRTDRHGDLRRSQPTSDVFHRSILDAFQFNTGTPAYILTLVEQVRASDSFSTSPRSVSSTMPPSAPTFTLFIGGTLNFNNASTAANTNIMMREGNLVFQNTSKAGSAIVTTPDAMHIGRDVQRFELGRQR